MPLLGHTKRTRKQKRNSGSSQQGNSKRRQVELPSLESPTQLSDSEYTEVSNTETMQSVEMDTTTDIMGVIERNWDVIMLKLKGSTLWGQIESSMDQTAQEIDALRYNLRNLRNPAWWGVRILLSRI